ncbi:hypothetical protein [Pedobacter sp. BMA]|uniref:hypothetical protein n=1 Tax=Pedobacter sp. BMA TaxID=1663685 RepID=UPI00069E548A|nr:hypothetical protein [Pedobacter sp. BMA]
MRNVTRSYQLIDAPAILQKASTITACTTIARSGSASGISSTIYNNAYDAGDQQGRESRVIEKLNQWYHGKCAYCERYYKLDVEHYRPKGAISDEYNNSLRKIGYYWLGYEWSNLLPSCISCNRDGGKGIKFPYLNGSIQVTAPKFDLANNLDRTFCLIDHQDLVAERPALLHPEMDLNIEQYFEFEIEPQLQGISIKGIDADRRGEITAIICKLNRSEIRIDRLQQVVMELVKNVHNSVAKLNRIGDNVAFTNELELYFEKIRMDCKDEKVAHTMLRKYIIASAENFDKIVIPFVVVNFQAILSHAFRQYLIKSAVKAAVAPINNSQAVVIPSVA